MRVYKIPSVDEQFLFAKEPTKQSYGLQFRIGNVMFYLNLSVLNSKIKFINYCLQFIERSGSFYLSPIAKLLNKNDTALNLGCQIRS